MDARTTGRGFLREIGVRTIFGIVAMMLTLFATAMSAMSNGCDSPQNLHETHLAPTSVTLRWDTVAHSFGYELTGGVAGNPGSFIDPIFIEGSASDSFAVSNLCVVFPYAWSVRALCLDSTGLDTLRSEFAVLRSFTTAECGSPAPASTAVNGSSATLMWQQASGAIGYRISGQQQGGPTVSIFLVGASSTQLTLNNLPAANFLWQVSSICAISTQCQSGFNFGGTSADAFTVINVPSKNSNEDKFEPAAELEWKVYPTVGSGHFTAQFQNLSGPGNIFLLDMMGRVQQKIDIDFSNVDMIQLDLSGYRNGSYRVQCLSEAGMLSSLILVVD